MTHDKKSLANEYCLCRNIPHRWVGSGQEQLVLGTAETLKDCIYSIYNIPYSEIIPTIDSMVTYDDFGRFESIKKWTTWKKVG